jgi:hypothetical protein
MYSDRSLAANPPRRTPSGSENEKEPDPRRCEHAGCPGPKTIRRQSLQPSSAWPWSWRSSGSLPIRASLVASGRSGPRTYSRITTASAGPRRTRAQRSEKVAQRPLPVRKLVTGITAVLGHHRQDEPPAISEQCLIDIRIMLADRCGHVGEVELDRSSTARLRSRSLLLRSSRSKSPRLACWRCEIEVSQLRSRSTA